MSTYDKLLKLTDTLVQEYGFHGFSYADLAAGLRISKASIHHHFATKNDLGLAYCQHKTESFRRLEAQLLTLPAGPERLQRYFDAFSRCAEKSQMCGVHAMLSDSHLLSLELQSAVNQLAHIELRILQDILESGQEAGKLSLPVIATDLAVIVCNALKGALMLNRHSPHETYIRTLAALLKMLSVQ